MSVHVLSEDEAPFTHGVKLGWRVLQRTLGVKDVTSIFVVEDLLPSPLDAQVQTQIDYIHEGDDLLIRFWSQTAAEHFLKRFDDYLDASKDDRAARRHKALGMKVDFGAAILKARALDEELTRVGFNVYERGSMRDVIERLQAKFEEVEWA